MRSLRTLAPAALLGAWLAVGSVRGQQPPPPPPPPPGFQPAPGFAQPTPQTQGGAQIAAVNVYQPPPVVNAYGYGPYNPYGYNPYGSYLSGAADLVNAQGQYAIQVQQSRLLSNQAYQASIDSRRAIWDQARYERETTMNSEQMRLKNINDDLRRARNDPPLIEVWSGQALNSLYANIQKANTYGVRGPTVPLDQEMLKHINLTTGVTSGGIGVLKDGGKFRWPTVFLDERFKPGRERIDKLTQQALEQAMSGPVDLTIPKQLNNLVDGMREDLKAMVKEVGPADYIEGKRYLNELGDSFTKLTDPNVANYFNRKWTAQGATVYDLAQYMTKQGLFFAPATAADKPSYTAFYQALLAYDVGLTQLTAR